MIHGPPFPISIDGLDAATLSTALDTAVAGFTSARIGEDRGMLGEIFLVTPEYAAGASGPETIICKFAALRDGALASAQRGGYHERELRCYDELLATVDVSTPAFYGAWHDAETAHFLLAQEAVVADNGVDQVAGIEPSLASLVGREAAKLHHAWWDNRDLEGLGWLPRLDDHRRINNLTTLAANGWGPLCDLLGDDLTDQEQALGHAFPERLQAALRELASMTSTLVHSDLRADNLLFAPDHATVTLIDWQGAGIGPGSFDIAYLLSHSLTVATRRRHGDNLVAGYLRDLSAAGTSQSRSDFDVGFALALHYGLAVACAMPLISDTSQPRVKQLAGAMARRSLEALRDYNQLW